MYRISNSKGLVEGGLGGSGIIMGEIFSEIMVLERTACHMLA